MRHKLDVLAWGLMRENWGPPWRATSIKFRINLIKKFSKYPCPTYILVVLSSIISPMWDPLHSRVTLTVSPLTSVSHIGHNSSLIMIVTLTILWLITLSTSLFLKNHASIINYRDISVHNHMLVVHTGSYRKSCDLFFHNYLLVVHVDSTITLSIVMMSDPIQCVPSRYCYCKDDNTHVAFTRIHQYSIDNHSHRNQSRFYSSSHVNIIVSSH